MRPLSLLLITLPALTAIGLAATHRPMDDDAPRPELGRVDWERDLDAALRRAKGADKPVLLLFQEIPG